MKVKERQPNYPMEHRLAGVALREDYHAETNEPCYEKDTTPSDVVLVEVAWLRYGNSAAWDVARTRPLSPANVPRSGSGATVWRHALPRNASAPPA